MFRTSQWLPGVRTVCESEVDVVCNIFAVMEILFGLHQCHPGCDSAVNFVCYHWKKIA